MMIICTYLAFVICKVLTKHIQDVGVCYDLEIPDRRKCDTTKGSDDRVYVKYDDFTFYPKYIVSYNVPRRC